MVRFSPPKSHDTFCPPFANSQLQPELRAVLACRVLGSTSAERNRPEKLLFALLLATGKNGCTEVRVYPAECGEQLGRDP